ncbi:hypothetical protein BDQ12DRAFT_656310 [Crucibulum laeve]|uniref:Uncharacterized protein n=1 Tax=Crucibulum laeve TaxID=68775 RepID=A0A5C3LPB2_9AGAR|nr:hypothetical protein BDQ12DRAFT_656310 [Crucibulum laeve]
MSLILLAIYLYGTGIYAVPLTIPGSPNSESNLPSFDCQCPDPPEQRSLWDIVWSCVATTFLCTWVTVHPNVPAPNEDWWWIAWRRFKAMYWSLAAPELTIVWAMQQWGTARALRDRYKAHGWTMVHGHFLQMGGFMLYEDGKPIMTLFEDHFDQLLNDGAIDFPTISEEEINDRSKGDALSKGLALFQTLWFIAQCIARPAQDLALTEIELTTLAIAVLSAVMYFFWWDKPLDVQQPFAVSRIIPKQPAELPLTSAEKKPTKTPAETPASTQSPVKYSESPGQREDIEDKPTSPSHISVNHALVSNRDPQIQETEGVAQVSLQKKPSDAESGTHDIHSATSHRHFIRNVTCSATAPFVSILYAMRRRIRESLDTEGKIVTLVNIIFLWPCSPILDLIGSDPINSAEANPPLQRVPTFYAGNTRTPVISKDFSAVGSPRKRQILAATGILLFLLLIPLTFGAIHCAAWFFEFPSYPEQMLWRTSSVAITALPIALLFSTSLYGAPFYKDDGFLDVVIPTIGAICVLGYFFARVIVLILSLITLRALPPSGYLAVKWSNFIPHFG